MDVPGILYKISGVFANANINIENFHSSRRTDKKSHGYFQAYIRFSVEIDSKTPIDALVKELESVEEIEKVRVSKRWIYENSASKS